MAVVSRALTKDLDDINDDDNDFLWIESEMRA